MASVETKIESPADQNGTHSADEAIEIINKTLDMKLLASFIEKKILTRVHLVIGGTIRYAIKEDRADVVHILRTEYGHKASAVRFACGDLPTPIDMSKKSAALRKELIDGYGLDVGVIDGVSFDFCTGTSDCACLKCCTKAIQWTALMMRDAVSQCPPDPYGFLYNRRTVMAQLQPVFEFNSEQSPTETLATARHMYDWEKFRQYLPWIFEEGLLRAIQPFHRGQKAPDMLEKRAEHIAIWKGQIDKLAARLEFVKKRCAS